MPKNLLPGYGGLITNLELVIHPTELSSIFLHSLSWVLINEDFKAIFMEILTFHSLYFSLSLPFLGEILFRFTLLQSKSSFSHFFFTQNLMLFIFIVRASKLLLYSQMVNCLSLLLIVGFRAAALLFYGTDNSLRSF